MSITDKDIKEVLEEVKLVYSPTFSATSGASIASGTTMWTMPGETVEKLQHSIATQQTQIDKLNEQLVMTLQLVEKLTLKVDEQDKYILTLDAVLLGGTNIDNKEK